MMLTVFSENFGVVRTDEELDRIVAEYPQYNRSYLAVASAEAKAGHRKGIEELWKIYSPYADKDFLQQLRVDFIARCWEMYITCVFLIQGFPVIPKQMRKGPDIQIETADRTIWVEAVSPKKGSGRDAVPAPRYGVVSRLPETSMLLRFANALDGKYEQYKKYVQGKLVREDEPFVIALNGGEMDRRTDMGIPLIMKCLFGLGDLTVSVPVGGGDAEAFWAPREEVQKAGGSPVSMMFFENLEHKGISAVIYCDNHILNHPPRLGKDCIVIHNPNASNRLGTNFLKVGYEYVPENGGMRRYDRNS